ncbi:hypothetical protein ACHAPT_011961 [Fusarium lateritium]
MGKKGLVAAALENATQLQWSLAKSPLLLGLIALVPLLYYFATAPRRSPLPPGPKGHPIFGMTFRMPQVRPWIQLSEWARTYGPLMHLRIGLQHVIVVSSGQISRELLDHRAKFYSHRPPSKVGEILARNMRSVLMPYGEDLKRIRKTYYKYISSSKCDAYLRIQEGESIATCYDLLTDQDVFMDKIARYSMSVARSFTFGRRIPSWDDQHAKDIKNVMAHFSEVMLPGKFLVDTFPFLMHLPAPLKPWMKKLEQFREWETEFILRQYRNAQKDLKLHPGRPSVAKDFDDDMTASGDRNELQAATTCMEILGVGFDTTANSILAFVQACIAYPETVKKAHEELDRVIGRGRYPTWDDEPNLPYIRAMIKEQQRWRPIAPMSFSHYAAEEDVVDGYRIPKGSIVRINTWAMHMDPERYPDPENYRPERFLNHHLPAATYAASNDVAARDHFGYGNGRRICLGIHVAERSLFLMCSRLLHTFDVLPALDSNGEPIRVDTSRYYSGLISGPESFKARFVIRNKEMGDLLEEEWKGYFGKGLLESWYD